jgi:hypothetical protein
MHRMIERLRAEFLEMPGLRLTPAQVGRLCGVDPSICQAGLDALVEAKFLRISTDGTYVRATEGAMAHPHPAKAEHTADHQRRRPVAS